MFSIRLVLLNICEWFVRMKLDSKELRLKMPYCLLKFHLGLTIS